MWSPNVPNESSTSSERRSDVITQAVVTLRAGGLVGLPTETVYGLGARADRPDAVRKIFAAKGRPPTHPLIAHVASYDAALDAGIQIPSRFAALVERFWPGPLTVVVPRPGSVVVEATGGLDSVAVRAPDHPLTTEVLAQIGVPVVAPSANRFGTVSPTTAQHVIDSLGDAVDLVVDGGSCRIGLESTILDIRGPRPVLLRPGGLDIAEIESLVGEVDVPANPTVAAPGTLPAHYAPGKPLLLISPSASEGAADADLAALLTGKNAALIGLADDIDAWPGGIGAALRTRPIGVFDTPDAMAQGLYQALRTADSDDVDVIVAWLTGREGIGAAIDDRLKRASVGSAGADHTPHQQEDD